MPPNVVSAGIFFCERLLIENDGVASAIRLGDLLTTSAGPEAILPIDIHAVVIVKGYPDGTVHSLTLKAISPEGKEEGVGAPVRVDFVPNTEDRSVPGGHTLFVKLHVDSTTRGTFYVCALLDGEELCRAPITLLRPPVDQHKDSKS